VKRTTIYLDSDLEIMLKLEAMRSGRSSVDVIREALRVYLDQRRPGLPQGIGEFDSGHTDTAERFDEILDKTGFGED
jgi:hypothetical protein